MTQILKTIEQFFGQDESGQGLVEYALLISLVALAVVGAVLAFGTEVTSVFQKTTTKLTNPTAV